MTSVQRCTVLVTCLAAHRTASLQQMTDANAEDDADTASDDTPPED